MKWYKTIIHPPRHWNRWLSLDSVWCSWGKVGWHRTWAGRYCDPRRANGPLRQAPAICTAPFKTLKGLLGLGEIGRATPKAWVILPSSGDFGGMEWLKHVDSFQNPWSNSWMVNIYIYIDSKILNVCTWLVLRRAKILSKGFAVCSLQRPIPRGETPDETGAARWSLGCLNKVPKIVALGLPILQTMFAKSLCHNSTMTWNPEKLGTDDLGVRHFGDWDTKITVVDVDVAICHDLPGTSEHTHCSLGLDQGRGCSWKPKKCSGSNMLI